MKKALLLLMAVTFLMGLASAQTYNANNFNYGGSVQGLRQYQSTAAGSATMYVQSGVVATNGGISFAPLKVGTPVTVGTGSTQETVTPTAVSCATPQILNTCNFTASFTYAHGQGTLVASGSAGLQEAINYAASKAGGQVVIDSAWQGTDSTITSAVPYQNVSIQDTRKAVQYWNPVPASLSFLAVPTTLISSTVASNLGLASGSQPFNSDGMLTDRTQQAHLFRLVVQLLPQPS